MSYKNRPLSPHLQVYRPQLTSVLSIFHRITGIALLVGLPFLVWFLSEMAFGNLQDSLFATLMFSFVGNLMLLGWTYCLAFHLCNGIRHLLWDIGWGFELETVNKTGWTVVIGSMVLTLIAWSCIAGQMGWLS